MMSWLAKISPRSIEGQMIALFSLALLVQLAALTVLEIAKHDSVIETASHERIIDRFETYLPLVEALQPEAIENLVGSTSTCHAGYRVSAEPFARTRETSDTRAVGHYIAHRIGVDARRVLVGYANLQRLDFTYPECSETEINLPQTGIVIGVQLADGRWFEAEVHPHEWHYREIAGWITQVGAIFLATAGIAFLLLRQLNKPLRRLTEAVRRFGDGMTVSPVEPSGPEDIRHAISSFNAMQKSVTDDVNRRTLTLAAISHDIRTPLTTLRLRAEMVEDATVRADLIAGIDKMERVNTSALEYLQGESRSEPMRTIDVMALLQSECDDFGELGHSVELDGTPGILLACRPEALARAVRNLIDNAVKYGGQAMVSLKATREHVEISVADTGPGIDEADMKRILEPFERLSKARTSGLGGFGLGLAVVDAVARGHEGHLVLSANTPSGLVATLRLPVHSE
jgi:signal transduction histidine kinase